jgi:hypothetical protein
MSDFKAILWTLNAQWFFARNAWDVAVIRTDRRVGMQFRAPERAGGQGGRPNSFGHLYS